MTTLSLEALRERLTALIAAACLSAPPVCPAAIRAGNGDILVEVDSPPAATAVAVDNEIHLLVTNAGASAEIRIRSVVPGWKLVSPSGGTGQVSVGSPLDYKIQGVSCESPCRV